ncbi:MAG: YfhO family protein [Candidatus Omnitrophica bacterium]|nr:YfhO family protein [Candidatus Omnitrophota bacterium]
MTKKNKIYPSLSASIFILLAVVIFFLPLLAKWQGIFHDDHGMSDFPIQYSLASNLQKGIIPIWDPYTWAGASPSNYPLIFTGGLYFPNWLFYLFADLSSLDKAYRMISILPLLSLFILAGIGMYVLLKKVVGCDYFPSVIGAVAYIFSPVFVYYYGAMHSLIMLAWLPWLLYLYISSVEKLRIWKIVLAGMILNFIWIAGRPHFMPYIMIIWASFICLSMIRCKKNKKCLRPLFIAVAIFILGTALSAIYLFPIFNDSQYTQLYTKLSIDNIVFQKPWNVPLPYLITLLLPTFFGSITGHNYIFTPLIFSEANMSGGMFTTLAVITGVFISIFIGLKKGKQNRQFRYLGYTIVGTFLYIFSLFCVLGKHTPFYRIVIGWIPIVGGLPHPARYRMIQCFAGSLLVAIGLNYLVNLKFFFKKYLIKKIAWYYIFFSFIVMVLILLLPQATQADNLWSGPHDYGVEGYYRLKAPVGTYTPKISKVTKIKVFFDAESKGEIRYSDNHQSLPSNGILVKKYSVSKKGWREFDLDIPPHKFIWIYPKKGAGNIGYWRERENPSFKFNDRRWRISMGISGISLYQEGKKNNYSLFYKLKKGHIISTPIVISFLYWFLASLALIVGVYFLSGKKLGYFVGIIIVLEFFIFGMMAFYGCEYTETHHVPFPEHYRYLRPSDHPMARVMAAQLPAVAGDSNLRIASDYPYYDNFAYLNKLSNKHVLMGHGIYPLEKRFKHAIETAYGQPMNYDIYEKRLYPGSPAFLTNFSVGYFLSSCAEDIFSKEKSILLPGTLEQFVHINSRALPRVYTQNRIIFASKDKQLKKLVSGNLREAVYMDFDKQIKDKKAKNMKKDTYNFDSLQEKNKIKNINFDNPNQINVGIDATKPAMLVFTEVWYPGWRATVDGSPAKIYRVNYCQRGVFLGKGSHQVKLNYSPLPLARGFKISLGTVVLMVGLLIYGSLKEKNE